MEFTLSTTGYFYQNLLEINKLEELGFKFESVNGLEFKKTNFKPLIKFDSFEEFIAFVDKYEEIIVTKGNIEIYDDYRE
jgi:hypothetical protein